SECRLVESEIEQAAVVPALCRLDVACRADRIVVLVERIKIARDERDAHIHRRREGDLREQTMQIRTAGREADAMAADDVFDLQLERDAFLRLPLAYLDVSVRHVGGTKRESALSFAADDRPDRVPALADFDVEIPQLELPVPLHGAGAQFLAKAQDIRADPNKFRVCLGFCLVHEVLLGTAPANRRTAVRVPYQDRASFRRRCAVRCARLRRPLAIGSASERGSRAACLSPTPRTAQSAR